MFLVTFVIVQSHSRSLFQKWFLLKKYCPVDRAITPQSNKWWSTHRIWLKKVATIYYTHLCTCLHRQMVGPVPPIPLDMNSYKLCFSMHWKMTFCHWHMRQNTREGRRYWAYHLMMQAGTAGIIDIDRSIDRSYIPFNACMALKWNNLLFFSNASEFTWVFGTKTTCARKLTCITP